MRRNSFIKCVSLSHCVDLTIVWNPHAIRGRMHKIIITSQKIVNKAI